ncbi:MAG: hypothetical protein IPM60_02805 [Rhodospirillales bacterium]|nr:hypothetical protein [Rhodospirillales bacterium]
MPNSDDTVKPEKLSKTADRVGSINDAIALGEHQMKKEIALGEHGMKKALVARITVLFVLTNILYFV